ncbi:MAG TPA: hypothetical protein VIO33_08925 [Burkholderiaceae bacterium]
MHIAPTRHEHGATAKVYSYEGDYEVEDDAIRWTATVSRGPASLGTLTGTIPVTSPALSALAEQAVRDDIVKRIDSFDDKGIMA